MSENPHDWSLTGGQPSRALRRARALSPRERLQAVEDMAKVAERFRWMRETGEMRGPDAPKTYTRS